jgi:hypothetical protein
LLLVEVVDLETIPPPLAVPEVVLEDIKLHQQLAQQVQ